MCGALAGRGRLKTLGKKKKRKFQIDSKNQIATIRKKKRKQAPNNPTPTNNSLQLINKKNTAAIKLNKKNNIDNSNDNNNAGADNNTRQENTHTLKSADQEFENLVEQTVNAFSRRSVDEDQHHDVSKILGAIRY